MGRLIKLNSSHSVAAIYSTYEYEKDLLLCVKDFEKEWKYCWLRIQTDVTTSGSSQ